MTDLNNWIATKYKWLKENIQLVILIPTILGGIWQIIELSRISVAFIRFFSVTQLISDGLLILYIIIIFYLTYQISNIGFSRNAETDNTKGKAYLIGNGLGLLSMSVAFFLWICIPAFKDFFFNNRVDLFYIALGTTITFILAKNFYIGIQRLVKAFKREQSKEKQQEKSKSKKFKNFLVPIAIPLIMAIFILIVGLLIKSILNFRNTYYMPKNLQNLKNIECYFKNELDVPKKNWEILYLNDKYIFTKYSLENSKEEFLILNYDVFLSKEECKQNRTELKNN